jgi:hypothetical protein
VAAADLQCAMIDTDVDESEVGSVTDGGLAGIILGWLLGPLVILCIAFCVYQRYNSD